MKNKKRAQLKGRVGKPSKPFSMGDVYQVDMEIPLHGPGFGPIIGWDWARAHYTGEEAMARAIANRLKSQGCGGRLMRHDGTPDMELVEQWASIGRLEWAAAQETIPVAVKEIS